MRRRFSVLIFISAKVHLAEKIVQLLVLVISMPHSQKSPNAYGPSPRMPRWEEIHSIGTFRRPRIRGAPSPPAGVSQQQPVISVCWLQLGRQDIHRFGLKVV